MTLTRQVPDDASPFDPGSHQAALENLKQKRILFCPHEIGGQMQLMVEELRRRGYYATAATYPPEPCGHLNDINLKLHSIKNKPKRHALALLFSAWAIGNYDIFHYFWGRSLYGFGPLPRLDPPLLRRLGKKVFVHFRGTDVVDLAYFDFLRARMAGDAVSEPPMSRPDQLRCARAWERYAHRLFVSQPDLCRVVPDAVLVQQAMDMGFWRPERPYPKSHDDGIFRIAHAPTLRRKKGTEFVVQSVAELQKKGLPVELVLIENVPFHQVKAMYEQCDIGVDQVLYGWYGKVSIELMALGRPVLCYIDPELHAWRADMPIVSAKPSTLTDELLKLLRDPTLRQELGRQGREFVARHHDVRSIVDQCLEFYAAAYAAAPSISTSGTPVSRSQARIG